MFLSIVEALSVLIIFSLNNKGLWSSHVFTCLNVCYTFKLQPRTFSLCGV